MPEGVFTLYTVNTARAIAYRLRLATFKTNKIKESDIEF